MKDDGYSRVFQTLLKDVSFLEMDSGAGGASIPEKKMWTAVVVRAVFDYVKPSKTNHEIYASAWAYLHSDSEEFGSLNWVLDLISNNPERLRADLHQALKTMTQKPNIQPLRVDK